MRVLLVALTLLGAGFAAERNSQRIVGGSPTTVDRYPFASAIIDNTWLGGLQFCGGTLITNRAVVTAAHCTWYIPSFLLRVRLGSTYASSGGTLFTVARTIEHQHFHTRLLVNDISIIRLSSAAVLSAQLDIARIAGPQYVLQDNTRLYVAGWGETTYQGRPSEVLQHVAVNLINQEVCVERYAYLKTQPGYSDWPDVTADMLCTGILDVGGKDTCQGDSGGPVIHGGNVLVGVTSWGYECAHSFYPGVSVRVSSYTDWILANNN